MHVLIPIKMPFGSFLVFLVFRHSEEPTVEPRP